jgi:hypothetical protein
MNPVYQDTWLKSTRKKWNILMHSLAIGTTIIGIVIFIFIFI